MNALAATATVRAIPLSAVIAYTQVRTMTGMDKASLNELAGSLKAQGMIQPIVVRSQGDSFAIVAGHRRVRAAGLAGFDHVPAIILPDMGDELAMEMQFTENLQRENLNLAETAAAVRVLAEMHGAKHVSKILSKSKAWISKHLSLTSPRLDERVRTLLNSGACEDLEILLALQTLTAKAPDVAARLIKKAADEKITRTEVRDYLAAARTTAGSGQGDDDDTSQDGSDSALPAVAVTAKLALTASKARALLDAIDFARNADFISSMIDTARADLLAFMKANNWPTGPSK